ncbi:MAG: hypothetical protein AB1483_01150 [Candidatus Zixiibacteriota bacterium]|mgnify:CR=1 FL=1
MAILRKSLAAVIILVTTVSFLLSCGITSRYRMDLYVSDDAVTKKVDVEQTQYVESAVISDPFSDNNNLITGEGNVAVVTVGTRWNPEDAGDDFKLMGFDQYWRCRLYVQLPQPVTAVKADLNEASYFQVLGQYDIAAEDKIFLAREGSYSVDSVTSKHVFMTIDGRYVNRDNRALAFSGQFKVRSSE